MENVYLIILKNCFYILCFFFHLLRGDSAWLWTLTFTTSPRALLQSFHFHKRMKEHPHTMDLAVGGSELCRALCGSSFEMYIQCEGLKWFLLNSIFYRFCRHFVVGRKNKRNFMGASLLLFSESRIHFVQLSIFHVCQICVVNFVCRAMYKQIN